MKVNSLLTKLFLIGFILLSASCTSMIQKILPLIAVLYHHLIINKQQLKLKMVEKLLPTR